MIAEGREAAAASVLSALILAVPVRDFAATFLAEGQGLLDGLSALARDANLPSFIGAQISSMDTARQRPSLPQEIAASGKPPAEGTDLTQREGDILHLISAGHTNKQIGRALDLTENTVKFHLRNIFGKLRVSTRTGAISAARQLGILR
jgi:LuxR family maltose regulon positive regulatory protein